TFILWMVLDLSGLSGSSGLFTKTDVGSVNGRGVDLRTYEQMVQNAVSERQQQLARGLGIEETQQVRDQVWESIVQNNIIEAEVERRNITVSSEEIAQVMQMIPLPEFQSDPTFHTEGSFD